MNLFGRLRIFIFAGTISVTPVALSVEIFFSPGRFCEDQIITAINNSKSEVVAAVYSINNSEIVRAIKAAHKRGVKVHILTDRVQAAGASSKVLDLATTGIDIRVHSKYKIEHNKFGVFDNKLAINGSYNWTRPASEENSENCAVMPEPNAVVAFKKRFNELWKMNSAEKSNKSLAKIKMKRAERMAASAE